MTISVGNTSTGSATAGTSLTVSHVVAAASNLLVAAAAVETASTARFFTTAQYAGVDMLYAGFARSRDDNARVSLFYLANPAAGTNNIVFNHGETISEARVAAADFGGALATKPIGTFAYSVAFPGTAASVTLPSDPGDYIFSALYHNTAEAHAPDGDQTEIFDAGTGFGAVAAYGTAAAGSTTMGWTWATSSNALMVGMSITTLNQFLYIGEKPKTRYTTHLRFPHT